MSHFTRCDLKMNNLEALKKALEDMKLGYEEAADGASDSVRGWRGQTLYAAMKVDMGTYDIGVLQDEHGGLYLVADWWGIETTKGVTEEALKTQIRQRYAYHNVLQACEAQGYAVEEEVSEEDGSINLVVRKWVSE